MARKANYDVKIEALQAKIAKKSEEIRELKEELAILEGKKEQDCFKELHDYMRANNMSADDVLALIQ